MGMDLIKHLVPPIERRSPTKYKSLATKTICCGRKFDLLGDIVLEKHTVVYFIHHHKLFLLIFYEKKKKYIYFKWIISTKSEALYTYLFTDCPPGDIVQEKAAAAVEHSHPSRKIILLQKVKVYNIVFGSIEISSWSSSQPCLDLGVNHRQKSNL